MTKKTKPRFKKGDEVRVTGKGRTETWSVKLLGTVVRVGKGKVYIQWHGLAVEDEVKPYEIEPAPACENPEATDSDYILVPAPRNRTEPCALIREASARLHSQVG
jgi:hypothetical protein